LQQQKELTESYERKNRTLYLVRLQDTIQELKRRVDTVGENNMEEKHQLTYCFERITQFINNPGKSAIVPDTVQQLLKRIKSQVSAWQEKVAGWWQQRGDGEEDVEEY
jgi:hypothetical protein